MYSPIQIRNIKQVFEQKDGSLLLLAGLPIDLEVKKLIHSGNDIFQIVGNILIDTDVYIAQYQLAK
jgi:hypothetical protein